MSESEEMPESEETLFPSEAAVRLGVTKAWVHRLIRDGRLPATRSESPIGHYYRIRASDLDAVRGLKHTGRPRKDQEDKSSK